jgi:hypothetical protein
VKHLTTYRLFESESFDEVYDYVNDVILSMGDDGFRCKYDRDVELDESVIVSFLKIEKPVIHKLPDKSWEGTEKFKWVDIRDSVLHILSFLKEENEEIDSVELFGRSSSGSTIYEKGGSGLTEYGKKIYDLLREEVGVAKALTPYKGITHTIKYKYTYDGYSKLPDDLELLYIKFVFIKDK